MHDHKSGNWFTLASLPGSGGAAGSEEAALGGPENLRHARGDWLKSTPTAGTKYHRLHTVIFSQILSRGESIFLPFCPPTSRNHLHSLAHTSLCSVSITSASLSLSFPSLAWKERVRTQGTAGYSRIPGDSSPSAHLHLQACNLISSAKSFFVGNRDLGTLEGEGTFALPDGSR